MSSDYKSCLVEIYTTNSQESQDGGIIVAVTGCLTGKDDVKKNFSQTFFLAKQENGFYVMNDLLQFFYVGVSMTDAAGSSDHVNDQSTSTKNSAPCDGPTSLNSEAAIQNEKVEEASDCSASEKVYENGAASTPSIPSGEKTVPPAEGAKPRSVVAPPANEKVRSVVEPATIELNLALPSEAPCDYPTPLISEAAIQNEKVEEASDLNASEKNLANGATSTPSIPSDEKSVSPAEGAKPRSVAPPANEKVRSVVEPATIELNLALPSAAPCDGPAPLNSEAAIQNGKVEEALDSSASENNLANGAASTPSIN